MFSLAKKCTAIMLVGVMVLLIWQCGGAGDYKDASAQDVNTVAESKLQARSEPYGFGKSATAEEIAGWDIDIRPDGAGLPAGSGTPEQGEPLYDATCAVCHGSFGEGEGRWPRLAGGEGSLKNQGDQGRPEKTVGSYWPYATTLFDYIRRAMPYHNPMSLSDDEAYAISAYVLYLNDLVDYDFVLDKKSLPKTKMPNQDNFYIDDRPDVNNHACMKKCKDPDTIKVVSGVKGVTPVLHFREGTDSPAASHDARDIEGTSAVALGIDKDQEKAFVDGLQIYQSACSACHQKGGEGLPPAFPSLKNSSTVRDTAAFLETVLKGRPGTAMQPYSSMRDEDLASVVSFVRGSWGNNASAVTAEQVAEAR